MTTIASMEADKRCSRSRAEVQDLLPGIPDEITLDHIASKLPWQVFSILSSVSHAWLHAIRTHQVYDARVRSHSTETLVLMSYASEETALFDMRRNSFYQLPSTPTIDGTEIRRNFQRVTLDGKLYVLGGQVKSKSVPRYHWTNEVHVLDLAGQKKWKKCANMTQPRAQFGCAAMNGKLYVFGGTSPLQSVMGSEVYDPTENKWSAIKPMISLRFLHRVDAVGEELFMHGGSVTNCNPFISIKKSTIADSWEFYHPGRDEWREVKPSPPSLGFLFVASGKVHCMLGHSRSDMQSIVQDLDSKSWAHGDFFSFAGIEPSDSISSFPLFVLAVDDDVILALVQWRTIDDGVGKRYSLVQGKGFGRKDKEVIMWEMKAHFHLAFLCPSTIYRIQL